MLLTQSVIHEEDQAIVLTKFHNDNIDPLQMKQNYQSCTDYLFFEPHPPAAPAADAKSSICSLDNGYPRPLLISLVLFNFEALLGID